MIIALQCIRRVFGRTAIEPGISRFLTDRKFFFGFVWLQWHPPRLLVPPSDHALVERLAALYLALVYVSGNILDPEFENGIHIFKEKNLGAMQTYNLRMTSKVHVLIHHVAKYVRRTGVPLEPSSEQALGSQRTLFDIFYDKFEVNCTKFPVFRERISNAALHYKFCHL